MTDAFVMDAIDPGLVMEVEEPVEVQPEFGGIAWRFEESVLNKLGSSVVADYEMDETARSEWKQKAENALDRAAQENVEDKNYPWTGASNVNYPMLTVAALQFQARAYPAIVKNDEAVSVKVFGQPLQVDPMAEQLAQQQPQTPEQAQAVQQAQQIVMAYQQASMMRQMKLRRSRRVAEYLNYQIFYGMPDWESDTDAMLLQLPIIGAAFRKTFIDPDTQRPRSCYVTALNVVVPQSATSLETTPRLTEIMPDVYPYQIRQRMREGFYVEHELDTVGEDDQEGRTLLEQYRYADLDDDGLEEPYIITVDKESGKVYRLEEGWTGLRQDADGFLTGYVRYMPYTLYGFIPDPKGRFYPIGFGHLLDQITAVVNTTINQLIDAGHAQIAGGGFIASGLRLQGAGRTTSLRWQPGEFKVVQASGDQLRNGIYERTFPGPSAVAFSMLEMMLGAVQDITGTSDVLTGQAPSTAPVGTTMALIEQGLQGFTAAYKRVYRSATEEYRKLYELTGAYGSQKEYMEVVDDPEANLEVDFSGRGNDVVPVSDPTVATKMQQTAKAQLLIGLTGRGLNDKEIYLRAFRAFDVDDPEELVGNMGAPPPGAEEVMALQKQGAEAELGEKKAKAMKDVASAQKYIEEAKRTALENGLAQAEIDAITGGLSVMEGPPGYQMG